MEALGLATELRTGDVLRLKKAHPCGGNDWEVVRLGADIGLRCTSCERRIMMPRSAVEKRTRTVVARRPEV